MSLVCARCSRKNPDKATYCYFDGVVLVNDGQTNRLPPGQIPFASPLVFADGQQCGNFDQLVRACQNQWDAAKEMLQQGVFTNFLGNIGRVDLAMQAKNIAQSADLDRALDQFLGRLPSDGLDPAQLHVNPRSYHFGTVELGSAKTIWIKTQNHGGRLLFGSVLSKSPWLTIGDGPGQPQKIFQCANETSIPINLRPDQLRANDKPLEGEILIESNGGNVKINVTALVPVSPFPHGVLAGAKSPRELALKAKESPKEAATLFEQGAVKKWYAKNGWTYPVQGTSASGVAAVQQFFEALGLVKAPVVTLNQQQLVLQGRPGETLQRTIQVATAEKRFIYAHAVSQAHWLKLESEQINPTNVAIHFQVTVPPKASGRLSTQVHIASNGNQRFQVPVVIQVSGSPISSARRDTTPVANTTTGILAEPPTLEPVFGESGITKTPAQRIPEMAMAPASPIIRRDRKSNEFELLPLLMHLTPALLMCTILFGISIRDLFVKAPEAPPPQDQAVVEVIDDGGVAQVGFKAIPVDPTPKIHYRYDTRRNFGISVAANQKRLTYSSAGTTNTTVVSVDNDTRTFGLGPFIHQEASPFDRFQGNQNNSTRTKNVWRHSQQVEVTQVLDIVPGQPTQEFAGGEFRRYLDTCLIAYQLENTDNRPHRVGLRLQLDTLIGSNDGVPFTVDGEQRLVSSLKDFQRGRDRMPEFIEALEFGNLQNPGTIANMTLNIDGLETPDRVSLAHWPGTTGAWNIPMRHIGRDSCIVVYWNERILQPGEKRVLGLGYGLGTVANDAGGKLGLSINGNIAVQETFTVTAYVANARAQEELSLQLDQGLSLVEGNTRQPVPPALNNQNSVVTWKVRVDRPGEFQVRVDSSSGAFQAKRLRISNVEQKEQKERVKNIFQ